MNCKDQLTNDMDKHLHIVSFDVPWPANYGGVIDVFYKIKVLHSQGVKIHLHTYEYGRGRARELDKYCVSVNYYRRDISKKHFFKRIPYIISSRNSEELSNVLLQDNYPILLEGLHTCIILRDIRFQNRKIIVRMHNIEHDYYNYLAIAEFNLFKKYYYYVEARKLKRFESVLDRASAIIAISNKDKEYFSIKYRNVFFIPAFHPHREVRSQTGQGSYVLYHGNLSVSENKKAIRFLLNDVFKDQTTPVVIAGLNPESSLKRFIANMPNVKLIINPDDDQMFRLINEAQINILITFQATGLKLKLLNVLYNGRFCIVNDKMLSGSTLDELCIVANDASAIKEKTKELFVRNFTESDIQKRQVSLNQLYHNEFNANRLMEIIFNRGIT
ncbi:MAG: glycosyltransferase family 4 protein [Bacteroidales bacterium]|jgi:hypothetical protein|nr:hypothetical protein [Mariniphaga sp.]NLB92334.1 glycosyltransferase family 4 protein [Bacteroidales bacterium]